MQPFKSGGRGGKGGKGKPAAKKKTFFRRRKVCRFTAEKIEYIDYTSEAPNDLIIRDGTAQMALHRIESWSAGCAALQASIPVAPGSACVAD